MEVVGHFDENKIYKINEMIWISKKCVYITQFLKKELTSIEYVIMLLSFVHLTLMTFSLFIIYSVLLRSLVQRVETLQTMNIIDSTMAFKISEASVLNNVNQLKSNQKNDLQTRWIQLAFTKNQTLDAISL